ncbi:hypothetical protein Fmac_001542 [Flemingia macrophylla]|uniref:Uncharacterized protein n=1 Tax=Flemingia macrophylla TaxID=520843 RepID=A0ABD1NHD8_9FABA
MYSVHNTITIPTCQQASFFIGQMSHYHQLAHIFWGPLFSYSSQSDKISHYHYPKYTPPKLIPENKCAKHTD